MSRRLVWPDRDEHAGATPALFRGAARGGHSSIRAPRYFLIGFANRLLVMLQWGMSFVTKRRGVRILSFAQSENAHADTGRQTVRSSHVA